MGTGFENVTLDKKSGGGIFTTTKYYFLRDIFDCELRKVAVILVNM